MSFRCLDGLGRQARGRLSGLRGAKRASVGFLGGAGRRVQGTRAAFASRAGLTGSRWASTGVSGDSGVAVEAASGGARAFAGSRGAPSG